MFKMGETTMSSIDRAVISLENSEDMLLFYLLKTSGVIIRMK